MTTALALLVLINLLSSNPFGLAFDASIRYLKTLQYEREFRALASKAGIQDVSTPTATSSTTAATSVPVLVYHGILATSDGGTVNTTRELFKQQLFALKLAGYQTISLDDLYAFKRGARALPAKPIMITFDDGRTDSYKEADPLLNALGFKATMFVITKYSLGTIKNHYYLNADELSRMEASGRWDIQPHTHAGHGDIPTGPDANDTGPFYAYRLWLPDEHRVETYTEYRNRIVEDMQAAKSLVQKDIGSRIMGFAFPFGDYGQNETEDPTLSNILIDESSKLFPLLFYQQVPGDFFKQTYAPESDFSKNSFLIRRISAGGDMDAQKLIRILAGSTAKSLPYEDATFAPENWILVWGGADPVPEGGVNLHAQPSLAGASMILDGTRALKDYTVTARITLSSPAGVFLWVRYVNDNNNAGCNFTPTFIHAEQTVGGEHRVIKGIDEAVLPEGTMDVTVTIHDRTISCIVNGKTFVQSEFLDPTLSEGGVGLKTWFQDPGVAKVLIHSVAITP
jgi:peptidoglycan/xylan/chitin deacetylase (PgdA/CDA1 family)